MTYLTIQDSMPDGSRLAFDLRHVLSAIGDRGIGSEWRLSGFEGSGGDALQSLEQLADSGRSIHWDDFVRLADGVVQVIDGVFTAFLPGEGGPWLTVRAVDGSAFDVETADEEVLRRIRRSFHDVSEVVP